MSIEPSETIRVAAMKLWANLPRRATLWEKAKACRDKLDAAENLDRVDPREVERLTWEVKESGTALLRANEAMDEHCRVVVRAAHAHGMDIEPLTWTLDRLANDPSAMDHARTLTRTVAVLAGAGVEAAPAGKASPHPPPPLDTKAAIEAMNPAQRQALEVVYRWTSDRYPDGHGGLAPYVSPVPMILISAAMRAEGYHAPAENGELAGLVRLGLFTEQRTKTVPGNTWQSPSGAMCKTLWKKGTSGDHPAIFQFIQIDGQEVYKQWSDFEQTKRDGLAAFEPTVLGIQAAMALRQGDAPQPPAETPPPTTEITDAMRLVLPVMLESGSLPGSNIRIAKARIARATGYESDSLNRPLAEAVKQGLLTSKGGPTGGYQLTTEGESLARSLPKSS